VEEKEAYEDHLKWLRIPTPLRKLKKRALKRTSGRAAKRTSRKRS